MANLFVLLVNHDWERHHCPEEFPRHLVDESTQRSLVVERKGRLCLWNVATGAQIPTWCYSPCLCSKHPDVPELYRAAFMVYAALDLPQGVGDVETLVEAHGKELATAVGLCVKLLEHNFKLHSQALQKVISRKNQKWKDIQSSFSRPLNILYRLVDSAPQKKIRRASTADTFEQACVGSSYCNPVLPWSTLITTSLPVPVLGLHPSSGHRFEREPHVLLAALRAIIHHNAIFSIFSEPVLLHTVGVVGGLLLQSRVQIWGDFRVPAGSKTDLKHCTAWIAATSHPWLR